jgi:hypothetical protein
MLDSLKSSSLARENSNALHAVPPGSDSLSHLGRLQTPIMLFLNEQPEQTFFA